MAPIYIGFIYQSHVFCLFYSHLHPLPLPIALRLEKEGVREVELEWD